MSQRGALHALKNGDGAVASLDRLVEQRELLFTVFSLTKSSASISQLMKLLLIVSFVIIFSTASTGILIISF